MRHALAGLRQFAQRRQRVRIILIGGHLQPLGGGLEITFYRYAFDIQFAEAGLRRRIARFGLGFLCCQVVIGSFGSNDRCRDHFRCPAVLKNVKGNAQRYYDHDEHHADDKFRFHSFLEFFPSRDFCLIYL